jgi:hypothetical protein
MTSFNPQGILLMIFGTSLAGILGNFWWGMVIVSGIQLLMGVIDGLRGY